MTFLQVALHVETCYLYIHTWPMAKLTKLSERERETERVYKVGTYQMRKQGSEEIQNDSA